MTFSKESFNSFTDLPDQLLIKWQEIADLLAGLLSVKAALIMKTENEFMEVFISSDSPGNPYQVGEKEKWHGLYCETVIKTQKQLLVADATKDLQLDKNPDLKFGMVAYLGFPINYPNNRPFGTLCVLDDRERHFSAYELKLFEQFKNVLELDLSLLQSYEFHTGQQAQTIQGQVRRLECISAISELVASADGPIDKVLKAVASLIPAGWERPALTGARIIHAGRQFTSPNFQDTLWKQTAPIKSLRELVGTVEVCLLAERPGLEVEIGFAEEQTLLSEIARQVGILIERKRREVSLKEQAYFAALDPGPVLRVDRAGRVTLANPAAASLGMVTGALLAQVIPEFQALNLPGCIHGGLTRVIVAHNNAGVFQFTVRGLPEIDQAFVYGSDISEREQAQKARQASEDRFRIAQEISLDAFTILTAMRNPQGQITDFEWTYLNAAAGRILHQAPEQLVGKRLLEILPGNLENRLLFERYVKIVESGRGNEIELEYRADGIFGWFRNMAVQLGDGVAVSFSNITERKQIEKALRDAFEYNRSLIEASLDPLVTIGPNGKITDVNRATENATGFSRFELIGTDFWVYFTEPELAQSSYQQVFREGAVRDYPLELRHRDGHCTSVLYNASIYRDPDGKVLGVFAAARDITERKQIEKALRDAFEYNRSLIEASLDPLVTIGPNGKITDVNRATENVTGFSRLELIGTDFSAYFTEPELAQSGYQQVFREGSVHDYPLELRHRDGHCTSVLYNASIYRDPDGNILGVFAAARDITERRQTEQSWQVRARLLEYSQDHSLDELMTATLDEVEGLTGSQIGFFHFLEEDQITLSLQNWSTRTLKEFCTAAGKGNHYPIDQAGVWVDCVRQGGPVIHNDYAALPAESRKGLPPGHAAVIRELVVPVLRGKKIVCILGVGNKAIDYTQRDVEVVMQMADLAWDISERMRIQAAEKEQRAMAETLRDTAAAFNGTLQLEEVLDCIIDNIGRVVPNDDGATVMLINAQNPDALEIRRRSTRTPGRAAALQEFPFSISQMRNLREMVATGSPVIIPDTHLYAGWVETPQTSWVRANIGMPIKIRGEIAGFLSVNSATAGAFTSRDGEHLQAFVDQAAIAIENARLYEAVQELAITDALTGVFNRRGLTQLGEREVESALRFKRPLGVVMLDLDHFKRVNDTYGHPAGDRVLRAVAGCCQAHVRSVDLVARYGGEEFILILTETDQIEAAQVAGRLRQSIADLKIPTEAGEGPGTEMIRVTASLGVVGLTEATHNLSDLLARVDRLMYSAKQAGRNRVMLED